MPGPIPKAVPVIRRLVRQSEQASAPVSGGGSILTEVTPHTIGGASHTAVGSGLRSVLSADPTRGDILTAQGATPAWAPLAKGAEGKFLKAGADEPEWDDVPPTMETLDFIQGDSHNFQGGIGDWQAVGGTLTDETDVFWPDAAGHNAKLVMVDENAGLALTAINGPFVAGKTYEAVVAVQIDETINAIVVFQLAGNGGGGGSEVWANTGPVNTGRWAVYFVRWLCEDDVDTAQLYIGGVLPGGLGTLSLRVGFAALGSIRPQDGLGYAVIAEPQAENEGVDFMSAEMHSGVGLVARPNLGETVLTRGEIDEGIAFRDGFTDSPGSLDLTAPAGGSFQHKDGSGIVGHRAEPELDWSWVGGPVAGDLTYEGREWDVGEDYLSLYQGQKDARTVQLYGGWNDVELRDNPDAVGAGDDGIWKYTDRDGNTTPFKDVIAGLHTHARDRFDADGATDDFTLSAEPLTDSEIVSLNGAVQTPTDDYTVSGTTLHMVAMPALDDIILASYASAP